MNATTKKTGTGLTLDAFIRYSNGESLLSVKDRAKKCGGVWNDSRKVVKGDIFVAIETENDDGHNYVKKAFTQGAIAALVAKKKLPLFSADEKKRLVVVRDPLAGLQKAAAQYRQSINCKFVGITGSSGKTTTRTFISAVLRQKLDVSETLGNWNNHIGVPLSLLRFTGREDAGVLEMGANHNREIHVLSNIVHPEIAVITNIGYAHIGYFGSLANIADAKFEIVDGMTKTGLLFLCGDDPLLVKKAKNIKQKVVYYGTTNRCEVRASNIKLTKNSSIVFDALDHTFEIPMQGRHFVYAALAALAVAREFGVSTKECAEAFLKMEPVSMRGALVNKAGATFIVDCYNANPSSMKSGIQMLCDVAKKSPRVAVIGDMLELGSYSSRLHAAVGKQLANAKVERLVAVGAFAKQVALGAISGGIKVKNIATTATSEDAAAIVSAMVKRGDTVLLKGSRGIHLETVLEKYK